MCKHIHAVIGQQDNTQPFIQERFNRETDVQELVQTITQQPSAVASVDSRVALEGRIELMKDLVKRISPETAESLLAASDRIIRAMKQDIMSQKEHPENNLPLGKISAHEKCKRQRKFFSVRKQVVLHKPTLSRPSRSETIAITEDLLHNENVNMRDDLAYEKNSFSER